ncbi:hypothetical protein [Bordetella genomosp. 1]|nr:hypothetical protein [Bordetella genomosp. 1]
MSPHMSPDDDTEDRDLRGLYRHLPAVEPSSQLDAAIRGRAASAAASDRRARRPHGTWHPGWGVAASVVAVCALLFLTDYSNLDNPPTLDSESDETAAVDEEAPQPDFDPRLAAPPPLGTYPAAPAPALPPSLAAVPAPAPAQSAPPAAEPAPAERDRPAARMAPKRAAAPAADSSASQAQTAEADSAVVPDRQRRAEVMQAVPAAAPPPPPAAARKTLDAAAQGALAGQAGASASVGADASAKQAASNALSGPAERRVQAEASDPAAPPAPGQVPDQAAAPAQSAAPQPEPAPVERAAAEGALPQAGAFPHHSVRPPAGPDATSRIEYIRALLRNGQREAALAELHSLYDDDPQMELPPDLAAWLPAAQAVPAAPSPLKPANPAPAAAP